MRKPKIQTVSELIDWCDQQYGTTMQTVDELLESNKWKTPRNRKALTLAGNILKGIDELREVTMAEILPKKPNF